MTKMRPLEHVGVALIIVLAVQAEIPIARDFYRPHPVRVGILPDNQWFVWSLGHSSWVESSCYFIVPDGAQPQKAPEIVRP